MPAIYPPLPDNIQIRSTANAGFGLFTTEPIPAGRLISQIERPLITVLDSARLIDTCEWCLRVVQGGDGGCGSLKACTGCKVVRYCSKVGNGELRCHGVPTLHGSCLFSIIFLFYCCLCDFVSNALKLRCTESTSILLSLFICQIDLSAFDAATRPQSAVFFKTTFKQ